MKAGGRTNPSPNTSCRNDQLVSGNKIIQGWRKSFLPHNRQCFLDIFRNHLTLDFLHKKCRPGLHVGWKRPCPAESEFSATDLVRRTGGDDARLAIPFRNHVNGFDGHVAHQQVDFDVREEGDFFFE